MNYHMKWHVSVYSIQILITCCKEAFFKKKEIKNTTFWNVVETCCSDMSEETRQMELGRGAQNQSQKHRGWKGPLGISNPTSCIKYVQLEQVAQGLCQLGLDAYKDRGSLLQFGRDKTWLELLFKWQIMTQVFQPLAKKWKRGPQIR